MHYKHLIMEHTFVINSQYLIKQSLINNENLTS